MRVWCFSVIGQSLHAALVLFNETIQEKQINPLDIINIESKEKSPGVWTLTCWYLEG